MNKPIKVILVLLVGLGLLALLSFLAVTLIFPTSSLNSQVQDLVEDRDSVTDESGSKGGYLGGVTGSDGGIAVDMPPIYYDNGGDGSKLIKVGTLALTVKDFDSSVASIKATLTEYKGYVISLTDSGKDNDRKINISVRVPSDKFDLTLEKFKAMGIEVVDASENSTDISSTYKDLQARLKNQKAYEKQLLTILNKATKVVDILSIQREVAQVRQEIESMESQLKSYDTQVSMSVINVSMSKASEALDVTGNGWKPQGVFAEALTALVAFAKGVATLVIWVLVFSPVVLVPYAVYYFVKKGKK